MEIDIEVVLGLAAVRLQQQTDALLRDTRALADLTERFEGQPYDAGRDLKLIAEIIETLKLAQTRLRSLSERPGRAIP